ncbi:hypothetical protein [Oceanobacillus oncorhynchi]|uniref:hypothetical protein n=1 Tax=Oceanobacillus oncorhynchi TaxID=545501 RepID=UPI001866B8A3|nr:hypothetical protein [Oceanobacillus oncorhynchi]
MYIDEEKIGDLIRDLDRFKFHLLEAYQKIRVEDYQEDTVSIIYRQPQEINGYKFYQFSYSGSLPMYRWTDKHLIEKLKKYILYCTSNLYDDIDLPLRKAKIFIQHFFSNGVITDSDNYHHKFIIDALRYSRIIADDNWKNISLDISGHADSWNHVQVYVVPDANKFDFGLYLEENKYDLVKKPYPHDEIIVQEKNDNDKVEVDIWLE